MLDMKIHICTIDIVRITVYNIVERTKRMVNSMEYMSAPEAARKWGISERRVQKLCEENRIPQVEKIGRMWLIPKNTDKPADGRRKAKPHE